MKESNLNRTIVLGVLISIVLAAALVIAGAKAGIIPGVSPLVVLFAWVIGSRSSEVEQRKVFFARLQVVGSAGAAVTAGVVFTAGIVQILSRMAGMSVPAVDIPLLTLASVAGAFLGWGFVGLSAKQMLLDPRLPAPEAVACDRLIQTAVSQPEHRPPIIRSLGAGVLGGICTAALTSGKYLSEYIGNIALRIPTPLQLPIPLNALYLGIGALLSVPTALLIFFGGVLNAATVGYAEQHGLPGTTFRWVGASAMVVAVLYSLFCYLKDWRASLYRSVPQEAESAASELLDVSPKMKRYLYGSIGVGVLLLIVVLPLSGLSVVQTFLVIPLAIVLGVLLSGIGGLLSLQVGSSASPVSGTVFVALLVLSLFALAIGLSGISGVYSITPLIVALCVAICAANDSSQDYKTMQLNGLSIESGYFAQFCGLFSAALIVPATLWLAHESFVLGSEALPAPQASFFATVTQSLFISGEIPWRPVMFGSFLGLGAVTLEAFAKRRGVLLSSLAFAVGIYLPSVIGTGILIGSLCRFIASRTSASPGYAGILTAAGLISGDALFSLGMAIAIVTGVTVSLPHLTFPSYFGFLMLLVLCGMVFLNYRWKSKQMESGLD